LWSGTTKLLHPQEFAVVITALGILPEGLIPVSVLIIPVLEIVAALGVILNLRGGLGLMSALLCLFMVVLGYGIYMGLDVDCGCFGPGDPEARAFQGLHSALYRDILMLAGIIYLYAWRYARRQHPAWMPYRGIIKNRRRV